MKEFGNFNRTLTDWPKLESVGTWAKNWFTYSVNYIKNTNFDKLAGNSRVNHESKLKLRKRLQCGVDCQTVAPVDFRVNKKKLYSHKPKLEPVYFNMNKI